MIETRRKKRNQPIAAMKTEANVMNKPADVIVSQALDELNQKLQENDVSLEELMDQARKTRRKLAQDKYHLKNSEK